MKLANGHGYGAQNAAGGAGWNDDDLKMKRISKSRPRGLNQKNSAHTPQSAARTYDEPWR